MLSVQYTATVIGELLLELPSEARHLHLKPGDKVRIQLEQNGAEIADGALNETLLTELTTQQAADYMNVTRPYFVNLLDEGKIPYRNAGARRRVYLEDVVRYMEEYSAAAFKALGEMAAENQRLGLYP